jgi:hemolysin activation/secretion protein
MKPVGIDDLQDSSPRNHKSDNIPEMVFNHQVIDLLDEHLPAQYRETYLRLKYGEKIYKNDLKKLQTIIQQILEEHGYEY